MQLKIATWDHFSDLQEMAIKFFQASPYKDMEMDESKVADFIVSFLEGDNTGQIILVMVDEDTNRAHAMLASIATSTYFSYKKIATEVVWWVEPEHRSSRIGFELIKAYEYWAKNVAGCSYIQLATVETEDADRIGKFYKHKGYDLVEKAYVKEIKA